MIVWRVTSARYASTAFAGVGAADYPGRWNHRGRRVVYASDTPALAMLEILVHAESAAALRDRLLVRAVVPDDAVYRLPDERLPDDWQGYPVPSSTRDLGEAWRSDGVLLALSVPSAVMPLQRNVLVSPEHPGFERIEIDEPVPLAFDRRLAREASAAEG